MGLDFRKPWSRWSSRLTRQLAAATPAKNSHGLPIGIDFGVSAMKVLQLTADTPPALVAAACLETPLDLWTDHARRLEFQLSALARLVKQGGFRGKRAMCTIPSWQMWCKHLQFPRQEGAEVGEQVEAAVALHMQCDLSSVVYRYMEIEGAKTGGKAEVAVMAIARDLVDRLMEGMLAARLEPVGMHTEFHSLLRAFDTIHRRESDRELVTLYLDIGAMHTNLIIAHGVVPVFVRVVGVGSRHLDEAVARQRHCTLEEARELRLAATNSASVAVRQAVRMEARVPAGVHPGFERRGTESGGVPPGFSGEVLSQPSCSAGPEGTDLTEPLEMLTDEVMMCVRYHDGLFPGRGLTRAVFVGGEARSLGICQQIARALKVPAQIADPLARVARTGNEPAFGVDMKQAQPGWSTVLGLCLSPSDL
jgi:type IV pilus assembly protein PilM